jgi:hypothetical protein
MESHVKAVAWIHIVLGALCLLVGLGFLLFFGGIAGIVGQRAPDEEARVAMPILGALGGFLFVMCALFSIPAILAGWGLLQFREWARILTIILSILDLLNIPIGTAIGIYSLWVLFNQQTLPLFRGPQPAAQT